MLSSSLSVQYAIASRTGPYRKAATVVEIGAPELVAAMDKEEISIDAAEDLSALAEAISGLPESRQAEFRAWLEVQFRVEDKGADREMKAIIERFQFQDEKQRIKPQVSDAERSKRTADEITPSLGEINMRLQRAEKKLGFAPANDFLPSLADLDKRLTRVEEKLNFASVGAGAWRGGDYLPSLDQLNARLQRVEQGLGFRSMSAVSGRGGDSQSAFDQGERAARQARERAEQIQNLNEVNQQFWGKQSAKTVHAMQRSS